MSISPLRLIAIVLLLLSILVALLTSGALNPLLIAVWSIAVLYVFYGVIP